VALGRPYPSGVGPGGIMLAGDPDAPVPLLVPLTSLEQRAERGRHGKLPRLVVLGHAAVEPDDALSERDVGPREAVHPRVVGNPFGSPSPAEPPRVPALGFRRLTGIAPHTRGAGGGIGRWPRADTVGRGCGEVACAAAFCYGLPPAYGDVADTTDPVGVGVQYARSPVAQPVEQVAVDTAASRPKGGMEKRANSGKPTSPVSGGHGDPERSPPGPKRATDRRPWPQASRTDGRGGPCRD